MAESASVELTAVPTRVTGLTEGSWYSFQVTSLQNAAVGARVKTAIVTGVTAPALDHAGKQWGFEQLFNVQAPDDSTETLWAWVVNGGQAKIEYDEVPG